jgi:hypothetical protein
MMLGNQMPLKVALCAPETRSEVVLVQIIADDLLLQALKLLFEKAKTLTTKEKTGEFKSQQERDQLSAALENEEHRGRT